ncbi:zinc dependent phospholipase C family protein [Bacillus sp. KH172YL63]|uniref:zinc dependent phospholipase C family protein n=1 Tax=Bacillus sp. KH172YL63 TaxID=2709784 RepID=UPI0013E52545|nr:zinc dependent phospholipase C family protein [Bacillus sp. KH172YL63]BCB04183.1 hypothetical protein KH172YL63_23160 [Bacillus sp. KH172YL63]
MATWMVHFRLAENLLNKGLKVVEREFVVGNIGPDCGLPDSETGVFYPGKVVTHFKEHNIICPELFFNQYLKRERPACDKVFSFYLGYYLHLVTDVEWTKLHREKKKEPVYQGILGSEDYTRIIKRDWYGTDFVYLKEHPEHVFHRVFQHITDFPDYIDIFPENQIMKQIKRISDFYNGTYYAETLEPDYRFEYLTPEEVTRFVDETTDKLVTVLKGIYPEEIWGGVGQVHT